ncbi:hypothetical protein ACFVU3_16155 [Streptomyces sp. NPDC058052]|uniref:hypothetical protein n=1 Tax=Streptomyces sp. NPDC058052 TaxID=3346316 RepID=UPI0036EC83B4
MSSHEPGQGRPAQQGYPQPGPAYGAHNAPPPPSAPPLPPSAPPGRAPSHRGAWIGAAATLVAAVIGVVGTYLVNSGGKGPAAAPAPATTTATPTADDRPATEGTPGADGAPTAATPAQETPGTQATPSTAPTTAPPATPPNTVFWQGTLVITYVEDKDLDASPPEESEINRDNDFAVYPFGDHMLRPDNGAEALVWKGSAKTPSYEDCAGVVDTQATSNDIRIKTGLTVCGRTGEGKLLRMTVKELAGQAGDTNATFDVVVWNG